MSRYIHVYDAMWVGFQMRYQSSISESCLILKLIDSGCQCHMAVSFNNRSFMMPTSESAYTVVIGSCTSIRYRSLARFKFQMQIPIQPVTESVQA